MTIQTNFSGLTNVGPQNGSTVKLLTQVTLDNDELRFNFDYTTWGQVWKIRNYAADAHLLNYRSYNLPLNNSTAQTDCPRFTERRDWAEDWNRSGPLGPAGLPVGAEQEVITRYEIPLSGSWTMPDNTTQTGTIAQVTLPDNTYHKIYFAGTAGTSSGWQRGLASLVETYDSADGRQRQTATTWTQDDSNVSYPLNPRVSETNVYDPAGNRARTRVTYGTFNFADGTSCQLPQDVYEYQANATTVLRRTHTDYNVATTYTSRRIIGVVSEQTLYEVDPNTQAETLMSKVGFSYDASGSIQGTDAPVQHDNTNYSAAFVAGRANLSSAKRYDVTNTSQFVTSSSKYNTAGATVSATDPLNHQVTVSYTDSFSDGINSRNTLAYPTTVTDADGFSSLSQYNFDFGAVTRTQGPPPAGQTVGAIKSFTYDSFARIQQVSLEFNGNADYSHTRFEYPTNQTQVDTYTTIEEGLGEAHSFRVFDGHGSVIAGASDHPGSVGGFSGQLTLYSKMGQVVKQSNPTETSASGAPSQWVAAGDDAAAGWLYTQQTYDWKGRPLLTTNTDGTTKQANYGGCGCAGGEVVTLTDEGTLVGGATKKRQQKIYSDVLGRKVKTEVLSWDGAGSFGTGGTVYSATVNTYNARDQVTRVRAYQGPDTSSVYQDTVMTYDGYARLKTRHIPEQDAGTNTVWDYNSDDTVQRITDARGASQVFSYNNRQLLTLITYGVPAGVEATSDVAFGYDAAGNRTSMTDGQGTVTYHFDQLSRVDWEERQFDGVPGAHRLTYSYNLAGQLRSIVDPVGFPISYSYDEAGRVTKVANAPTGETVEYAKDLKYRAWGAVKELTHGNNFKTTLAYNDRLQLQEYKVEKSPQLGSAVVMRNDYEYYGDGRVSSADDGLDNKFDRSYGYDQAGRMAKAYTVASGPYRQDYQRDVWGNLTARDGQYWSEPDNFSASYVNNRRQDPPPAPAWTYDASGNVLDDTDADYTYDAAGRNRSVTSANGERTTTQWHDGDGEAVRVERRHTQPALVVTTAYYVRSSVLGGRVVTELNSSGQKVTGKVYLGGAVLGVQDGTHAEIVIRHEDPVTGSYGESSQGTFRQRTQADPMGVNVGLTDPFLEEVEYEPDLMMAKVVVNRGGECGGCPRCFADGIEMDCRIAGMMLGGDAAARCPDDDCGSQAVYNPLTRRRELTRPTFNTNSGQLGYWPNGASGPGVVYDASGNERVVSGWTGGHETDEWVCCDENGNLYPQPTAYSGTDYFITGSPQNSIRNVDSIMSKIRWIGDNVTKPELKSKLQERILQLLSKGCAEAFKRAGLPTPEEVINRGLTIASQPLLNDPSNNETFGISESVRAKAAANEAPAQTIQHQFTSKGAIIFFRAEAFSDEAYLNEAVAHEFTHAAGVGRFPLWGYILGRGTDLSGYGPYQDIINNCGYQNVIH